MNMYPWHHRSIRLAGYDYSSSGAYFVTLCVQNRECVLASIVEHDVQLTPIGEIAAVQWADLSSRYPYVELDAWVIMPNHLHGIVVIGDTHIGGDVHDALPQEISVPRKSLGSLIGAFKTMSTKAINRARAMVQAGFWQRSFYEHIIRNEADLIRIRRYIEENPLKWAEDRENPAAVRHGGNAPL
jgi:REP element-mobilizing transposase RayT